MIAAARWLSLLALATLGCASHHQAGKSPIGQTREADIPPPTATDATSKPSAEAPPEDIIVRHAAPLHGYRQADQRDFKRESFFTHVADADVICVGERHDQPQDHFGQLELIHALLARRDIRGFRLGLGLEMVRSYNQPVLTDFIAGELTEDELEERTAWAKDWGFPIQYYRPQMREILVQGGDLLALGVPQDITRKAATQGWEGLNDNDRRVLPELDTKDALHRELFELLMKGHPGLTPEQLDHYYLAQVIWDESMAARAADWIKQQLPGRKLVIFAGAAHCHPHAIPRRIQKYGPIRVVSVLPAAQAERPTGPSPMASAPSGPVVHPAGDPAATAEAAAGGARQLPPGMEAREALIQGYDYLLLFER